MGNLNPTKDQGAIFGKGVHIETGTDAKGERSSRREHKEVNP